MSRQRGLSLQIPIRDQHREHVAEILRELGNPSNLKADSLLNRENFPEVHFARWIIAPATTIKGKRIAASVVYSSNFDGTADAHIQNLIEKTSDFLDRLFKHCEGYGGRDQLSSYISRHRIRVPALWVGAINRTVDQIHNEMDLHRAVAEFVNNNSEVLESDEVALREIKKWLAKDENLDRFAWARKKWVRPRMWWIPTFFILLLTVIPLLIIDLLLIPFLHLFYERRLEPLGMDLNQVDHKHIESNMKVENKVYQNQLSQVFITKPGLRRVMLGMQLAATQILARTVFVHGILLGTPTIHFARWNMLDGGKRFVFFSNFDGSYDEYLGDFVDNSGWGLNAIYGAAKGYPRTKFFFGGGSYQVGQFLGWGRYCQVETQAWYSAYPNIGLEQIINNSELRRGLFGSGFRNKRKIAKLLRRI